MKDRQVNIKLASNNFTYHLVIELVNTLGVVVGVYGFYNYIGNGDGLTTVCDSWVRYGTFPSEVKGLVKIN